ncbi:MAG: sensor histidine kinase [Ruminococcaceae bacterium]|nr:sensor histidine kinase [Oscillospiraceae bacterium]
MRKINYYFRNLKLRHKLVLVFLLTSLASLGINILVYMNLNTVLHKMDIVYSSNISLNSISDNLERIQTSLTGYLETKGTNELETYYKYSQEMTNQLFELNSMPTDNTSKLTERNIRMMADNYLKVTEAAVTAKRGRNIMEYTRRYEECQKLYNYLNAYIYSLNNEQFKNNSDNYKTLMVSLQYSEILCLSIFAIVSVMNVLLIVIMTGRITMPLTTLSEKANEISKKSPETVEPLDIRYNDEIGTVTKAFNQMLLSIKEYIRRIREQMVTESAMKEKSLLMENHLKDAQLKYLQAQINPHFLFNTLNAGAQLAMMEGADRTNEYIRNMADFFRYNVKKDNEVVTIAEEIGLVDSYIYILNVRFSGDIRFRKVIDETLLDVHVPSMIIQPLVENSIKYGRTDPEEGESRGEVVLSLYKKEDMACIEVGDNGPGMDQETVNRILAREKSVGTDTDETKGIGLNNVISRLDLFYDRKEGIDIISGSGEGTRIVIKIPME